LEALKNKVWNIPADKLELKTDLLGTGKYGSVMKGSVIQKGFPVPVAVHSVAGNFCLYKH
jgi:hypothetical protein